MRANRFDSETILSGLLEWVREESPSYDAEAVGRMLDKVAEAFRGMDADVTRYPGQDGFADVLKITVGNHREPGILVLGHVDTVHPVGSIESQLPVRREGDRVYGPGILDMKGGLYLAIHALRELVAADRQPGLPVTFLIIPDEEVGSPTSRERIEAEARQHHYVLVPEPAREGKVVTGRHAFLRYHIHVLGQPAHAGADNKRGVSAISCMTHIIQTLESQSDFERGLTYSVGVVHGGTFVNVVPIECSAEVLCVAPDEAAIESVHATMSQLKGEHHGARIEVNTGPVRPLFRPSAGGLELFERARSLAAELGIRLEHGQFGGGSDGNFTGALGLPTLDGLGPVGGGPHTHDEHILVSSLGTRCRIFAGLLETLS